MTEQNLEDSVATLEAQMGTLLTGLATLGRPGGPPAVKPRKARPESQTLLRWLSPRLSCHRNSNSENGIVIAGRQVSSSVVPCLDAIRSCQLKQNERHSREVLLEGEL